MSSKLKTLRLIQRPQGHTALQGRSGCSSDGAHPERVFVRTNPLQRHVLSLAGNHAALHAGQSPILGLQQEDIEGRIPPANPRGIGRNRGAHRLHHVSWTFGLSPSCTWSEGVPEACWLDGRQYYVEFQGGPCLDVLPAWKCRSMHQDT